MAQPTDDFVSRVLDVVAAIPAGRVMSYGDVAAAIGSRAARGVGQVMAYYGGEVPWWRVVRADGSLPPSHDDEARQAYLEEGTPLRPSGSVDVRKAVWSPEDIHSPHP